MGQSFKFVCLMCGYTASVSGGMDYGMLAIVQTMTCLRCRKLVDVLVGAYGTFGAKTGDRELDEMMNLCPDCGGRQLKVWPDGRPCPKCDGEMNPDGELTILWD